MAVSQASAVSWRMTFTQRLGQALRDVPDFPLPGILFKDITPVLAQPALLTEVIHALAAPFDEEGVTHVVGVESRGFLFGVPVALALGVPFAPARKPGKLPWKTLRASYSLEYGESALEMHVDALAARPGDGICSGKPRVLVVDDVLATGGTAKAACRLVEQLGGEVVGVGIVVELDALGGRQALGNRTIHSLVHF